MAEELLSVKRRIRELAKEISTLEKEFREHRDPQSALNLYHRTMEYLSLVRSYRLGKIPEKEVVRLLAEGRKLETALRLLGSIGPQEKLTIIPGPRGLGRREILLLANLVTAHEASTMEPAEASKYFQALIKALAAPPTVKEKLVRTVAKSLVRKPSLLPPEELTRIIAERLSRVPRITISAPKDRVVQRLEQLSAHHAQKVLNSAVEVLKRIPPEKVLKLAEKRIEELLREWG